MTMSTTIEPEVKVLAWHFAPNNWKLRFSKEPLEVGKTYEAKGIVSCGVNGMHASVRAIDALSAAHGSIISRVELWGEVHYDWYTTCARYRTHLAIADATMMLHEFAIRLYKDTNEQIIAAGWEPYHDYMGNLEFKRNWLDKKKPKKDMKIAREAAPGIARLAILEGGRVAYRIATRSIDDEVVRKKIKEAAIATEEAKYNNWLEEMLTDLLQKPPS